MHVFTHPSKHLRDKVHPTPRLCLHHTSLYIRLILDAKQLGDRTGEEALHSRIRISPIIDINILKSVDDQFYNGKLLY